MSDCGDVKKVFVPTDQNEAPAAPIKGILIDDGAAEKIVTFLKNEGKDPSEAGLWVCVKKDGCSGLSYDMELKSLKECEEQGAKIFEHENGAKLFIEKLSYFYLTGSILTYTEALTGSGFVLNNPNIKGSCACGSSFSV